MLLWSFLILSVGLIVIGIVINGRDQYNEEESLIWVGVFSLSIFFVLLLCFVLPGPRSDRTWLLQFEQAKQSLTENRASASPLERVQILKDVIEWNNELISKQRGYTNPWISNMYAEEVMKAQLIK